MAVQLISVQQSTQTTFQLGRLLSTPGALALLEETGFNIKDILDRHRQGNWGDVDPSDAKMNVLALKDGSRIMSVYRLASKAIFDKTPESDRSNLPTVWVITEATDDRGCRQCTTVLLPSDY